MIVNSLLMLSYLEIKWPRNLLCNNVIYWIFSCEVVFLKPERKYKLITPLDYKVHHAVTFSGYISFQKSPNPKWVNFVVLQSHYKEISLVARDNCS